MSDRWHIFKDGKAHGPYSAAEIRDQLREGDLDPFDLVAREGSSVRRELVEIDELFSTSKAANGVGGEAGFEGNAPTESMGGGANGAARRTIDRLLAGEGQLPGGFVPPNDVLNGNLHLASDEAVNATQVSNGAAVTRPPRSGTGSGSGSGKRRKKDAKHFNLKDPKGRVLGPLSANDIQGLFYKGVIDKNVLVLKQGSSAKVPVDRFVAVFARSKSGGGTRPRQQGAHPALSSQQRSPTMLRAAAAQGAQRSTMRTQKIVTVMLVIAAVAMLGLAGYLAYKKGATDWVEKKVAALTADEPKKPRKKRREPRVEDEIGRGGGKLPRPEAFEEPGIKKAPKRKKGAIREVPVDEDEAPVRVERKAKRDGRDVRDGREARTKRDRDREREKKRAELLKRAEIAKRKRAAPPPLKTPRPAAKTSKVAFVPAPVPKPAPLPAPAPAPAPAPPKNTPPKVAAKAAGQTVGSLANGQQVSRLGPMRYDPAAVAKCSGPCVVTFSGAGGSVTGRFFKDGFGDALAAKKGSAYISGIVRKSGGVTTILIQDVQ